MLTKGATEQHFAESVYAAYACALVRGSPLGVWKFGVRRLGE